MDLAGVRFSVRDLSGRVVLGGFLGDGGFIDTRTLKNGSYFLSIGDVGGAGSSANVSSSGNAVAAANVGTSTNAGTPKNASPSTNGPTGATGNTTGRTFTTKFIVQH
jgi:hypothetical protein